MTFIKQSSALEILSRFAGIAADESYKTLNALQTGAPLTKVLGHLDLASQAANDAAYAVRFVDTSPVSYVHEALVGSSLLKSARKIVSDPAVTSEQMGVVHRSISETATGFSKVAAGASSRARATLELEGSAVNAMRALREAAEAAG